MSSIHTLNKRVRLRFRQFARDRTQGLILFLSGITLLLAGCATPPDDLFANDRPSPLMVGRSGDTAVLSWRSEVGKVYTVLYTDGPRQGTDWRPLEGARNIRGSGREIRLEDRVPYGHTRNYRLMIGP